MKHSCFCIAGGGGGGGAALLIGSRPFEFHENYYCAAEARQLESDSIFLGWR